MRNHLLALAAAVILVSGSYAYSGEATTTPAKTAADPTTAVPPPAGWFTNLEEAAETARKERKKILLLLTGSDWCGFCKRLRTQALDSDEGKKAIGDCFVGVYIDFPRQSAFTPEQKKYNRGIMRKFAGKNAGYPTTYILEPDLSVIGEISGFKSTSHYLGVLGKSLQPRPPLHDAVLANDIEKVKKALKDGADAAALDAFGKTALEMALQRKNNAIAITILENGGQLTPSTHRGPSAFVNTVLNGAPVEVVKRMLELGANVNAPEWDNSTYPLHILIARGASLDIIKALVDAGADLKATDGFGFSPLHAAAVGGNPEIIQYLLDKGLDPMLKGVNGKTPAQMARGVRARRVFEQAAKK